MKISREAKIGITAVIVIGLTIWGYNFLKGKNILQPTNDYYIVYDNISGLIESGTVSYNGYKIGNINSIYFNPEKPDRFVVKIVLESKIKVPLKSRVKAVQTNIIASAKDLEVMFYDTTSYHQAGDTLLPAYDAGLLGMIEPIQEQLDQTLYNLNGTLAALYEILGDRNTQTDLKESIHSLRNGLNNLSTLLSPNGSLTQTADNLASISNNLENKNEAIGTSIDNFKSISDNLESADLAQTISFLDSTLHATYNVMAKIDNSEGSAGLLINDSSLYNNLSMATASLDSLLTDLKEHPKRYVHFSLFGGKKEN